MGSKSESGGLNRRDFVAAVGSSAMFGFSTVAAAQQRPVRQPDERLVDASVSISRWPLRRVPCDETPTLVEKLRQHGVTSAWAGTFDGVLHKDLRSANARLAAECRNHGGGILVPFGSVNPKLPDWEEDLRLCAKQHRMPGVRLHPNYHGYKLDDPAFARLMSMAVDHGLIVQIAVHLEDERMMHPLLRVEPVNTAPLEDQMPRWNGARVVLLNALNVLKDDVLARLLLADEVYVEIATLEGVGGLDRLLKTLPLERILYGSHAPLFYFESAELKLQESTLSPSQLAAIRYKNTEKLLSAKGAHS
jgi:predicted TIM-barrel fold metal-dependent hydrolase